jgi:hypothetical protein
MFTCTEFIIGSIELHFIQSIGESLFRLLEKTTVLDNIFLYYAKGRLDLGGSARNFLFSI